MTSIKGTPIESYITNQQKPGARAPKLCLIRGAQAWDAQDANTMASACIKSLKSIQPGIEVSDLCVADFSITQGASNDPNESNFVPGDQLPAFFDPISQAHGLLFAVSESQGLPDPTIVLLLKRLNEARKGEDGGRLFERPKFVGVVAAGTDGTQQAAWLVLRACSAMGCYILPHAAVGFDKRQGDLQNGDNAGRLQTLARSFSKAFKATF